jgi:excisionase family DNA binding protein
MGKFDGPSLGEMGKSTAPPEVLTVPELAEMLHLAPCSVFSAIKRGEIPGVRRIGKSIRICRQAVLDWLASGEGRAGRSQRSRIRTR